jgi:hypothetical protein
MPLPTQKAYRLDLVNFRRLIGCKDFSFCYTVQERAVEGDGILYVVELQTRVINLTTAADRYPAVVRGDRLQSCCAAIRAVLFEAGETLDDPQDATWDELPHDSDEIPDHTYINSIGTDEWFLNAVDPIRFPLMPTGSIYKRFNKPGLAEFHLKPLWKQVLTGSKCGNSNCPNRDAPLHLKYCSKCLAKVSKNFCARYCSRDCQKKDWSRHKLTCGTKQ